MFHNFIDTPIDAFLVFQENVQKKTIRITSAGVTFDKLLKGQSNLKNTTITQPKTLYTIEEETGDGWVNLSTTPGKLLEITCHVSHIVMSNREANSYACYGGK